MKALINRSLSLIVVLSVLVGIVGIMNIDTTYAASKKIHLKKTSVSLAAGKAYQQKLIDKNGKTIKATKIKWKSAKPSVAKVNKNGRVTAVKAGTAKMTAKYKGKTYNFKIVVSSGTGSSIDAIYKYVKDNGYSVNSDYLIPGNRCIESDVYYGSNYSDIYVISIDTNNSNRIYFGSFRTISAPGYYKDTTETTVLTYDKDSKTGPVSFCQIYYMSNKITSRTTYISSGILSYADYTGASYYPNEQGISNVTKGFNKTPVEVGSYDSKSLIEGVKGMTTGVDKLLKQALNLRLRNIGFKNL